MSSNAQAAVAGACSVLAMAVATVSALAAGRASRRYRQTARLWHRQLLNAQADGRRLQAELDRAHRLAPPFARDGSAVLAIRLPLDPPAPDGPGQIADLLSLLTLGETDLTAGSHMTVRCDVCGASLVACDRAGCALNQRPGWRSSALAARLSACECSECRPDVHDGVKPAAAVTPEPVSSPPVGSPGAMAAGTSC